MALKRPEIKKLDKIWADLVKTLANYRCEYCRILGWMEAAHVVGRRHRTTRWGIRRVDRSQIFKYDLCGHCLCHRCHQQYDEHGPLEHNIIEVVVGIERKKHLQFIAKNSIAKYQVYEEIKETLESLAPGPNALKASPIKK